jgi:glycosyltransferase involved in cell wall biosynthesis
MLKFSVIVPIYNTPINHLENCLKHIDKQSCQDFECICVDDCSTNNDTIRFIEQWTEQHSNFKIIKNKTNLGPGVSRNIGIKNAVGEYIIFCDSDDWLEEDALEVLKHYLKYLPELELLSFENLWFINNERVKVNNKYDGYEPYVLTSVDKNHNIFKKSSTSWSNCYLRKFIIDNNIYYSNDKLFGEDLFYHILVFSKSKSFYLIEETIYVYRRNSGSSFYDKTSIEDKMNGLLHYAIKAYDYIKTDSSKISNHYSIFVKFLWENYILSFLTKEEQKQEKWFIEIEDKYQKFYQYLVKSNH